MTPLRRADIERSDAVVYDCQNGIAVVTMTRPDRRNALSVSLVSGLVEACTKAVEDGATALVLTGEGRSFCAGGDLSGVNVALDGDIDEDLGVLIDQLHEFILALRALPMPTVAAVNGVAVGAGLALALACDVRVVGRSVAFVTGYVALGASPEGGASFHLARALGAPQALASLVTNRSFNAAELRTAGLVDDVVDDTEVVDAGRAFARKLASLSFPAIGAMRELVYAASGSSLKDHLDREKVHFLAVARTSHFQTSMAPYAPGSSRHPRPRPEATRVAREEKDPS
jgi:2-(1,2-epoxy-1,2-dihydrophenyl)acetyl-CoA isomerase